MSANTAERTERRPTFSIVVLNYNGEALIARCLDHLLAQTYEDFEIIVVDNASTDGSTDALRPYEEDDRVHVLWCKENHGVPGGRNVGMRHCRGRIIAFIDNDGYADSRWLESALPMFDDPTVGAIASVVFFNRKKVIVNGAGGTLNLRGYGGDHCFQMPYEFAELPGDVLYPMGCGMMIRKTVADEMDGFDELIFNYYDDVELGINVWNLGRRVVVCKDAWIDHEYGSSNATNYQKVYLCERNRIRTAFKYFPLRRLPFWLLREVEMLRYVQIPGLRDIPFRAWGWNLANAFSAFQTRRRKSIDAGRYWALVAPTHRQYPAPLPSEHVPEADIAPTESSIRVGNGEASSLVYGWHPSEHDHVCAFRWATPKASVALRLGTTSTRLALSARSLRPAQHVTAVVRHFGEITPLVQVSLPPLSCEWGTVSVPCGLPPGDYEVQLLSARPDFDPGGRPLGFALSALELVAEDVKAV